MPQQVRGITSDQEDNYFGLQPAQNLNVVIFRFLECVEDGNSVENDRNNLEHSSWKLSN